LDVPVAAWTVFTTVNSVMADKMIEISTKRGYDVRDFALVVGGGAGPVHGAHLAELLEIPTVVIPRYAATYSAFGMLNMEVGRDFARSIIARSKALDLARLNALLAEMEADASGFLGGLGVPPAEVVLRRSVEMRYLGQFHEVEVTDVPAGAIGPGELAAMVEAFHRRHRDLFTFDMPKREVEFLNARVKGTARREPVALAEIPQAAGDAAVALKRRRPCLWDPARGYEDTPVYDGSRLAAGHVLAGPAVIEERTTTVVVPAAFTCRVDRWRNYLLTRRA
jgi:N-methylhydantoinase A